MLRVLILLSSFFFSAIAGFGQNNSCPHTLMGEVKTKEGELLIGATIFIEELGEGMVTDEKGLFQRERICKGKYTLTIHFVGYKPTQVSVSIPFSRILPIILEEDEQMLNEVLVEDQELGYGRSQVTQGLNKEDLENLHGKTLGEALKEIPGVTTIQTGPSIFKPVIHGLHSQRIMILNNGLQQEGQQWGVEHAPEIDPNLASQIEVIKGAEAVRYGSEALGGVILINSLPLHHYPGMGGELSLMGMSNNGMGVLSGMLEGGLGEKGRWGWRVQGTSRWGGDYRAPQYVLSNTGIRENNFSMSVGTTTPSFNLEFYFSTFNTTLAVLRAAHAGNLDDIQQSIESGYPWYIADFTYDLNNPRQEIHHHLLKVKASKNLKEGRKLSLLYGAQYNKRKEFDIRKNLRSDIPSLSLDLFSHVLNFSYDFGQKDKSFILGLNTVFKDNQNVPGTGIRPILPNYQQFSTAGFWIGKQRHNKWYWEEGIRYDFQHLKVLTFDAQDNLIKPVFNFHYGSIFLGTAYAFGPYSKVQFNLGMAIRPPHVSELYSEGLHHGTASIEEGLMRLGGVVLTEKERIHPEQSIKGILSYFYNYKKFSIEVSPYYHHIQQYVYLSPIGTRLTIRGYFPVFQYQQTNALLSGVDVKLGWSPHPKVNYIFKGMYVYASDMTRNHVLISIPPAQIQQEFRYDWWAPEKEKSLFTTVSFPTIFKQFRAPQTIYPVDVPQYQGTDIFDLAPPPSGYTLMHVRMGYKVPVKAHTLSIVFSAENVANTRYRNYNNRLRYYADESGRTFNIQLHYEFFSDKH